MSNVYIWYSRGLWWLTTGDTVFGARSVREVCYLYKSIVKE